MATFTNKWHALFFSAIVYYGTKYLDLGLIDVIPLNYGDHAIGIITYTTNWTQ